jgi:hypothetical protein
MRLETRVTYDVQNTLVIKAGNPMNVVTVSDLPFCANKEMEIERPH